jgi:hypothetical protein
MKTLYVEHTKVRRATILKTTSFNCLQIELPNELAEQTLEFAEKVEEFEVWLKDRASGIYSTGMSPPSFLTAEVKTSAKSNTRKKVSKSAGSGRSKKSTEQ